MDEDGVGIVRSLLLTMMLVVDAAVPVVGC